MSTENLGLNPQLVSLLQSLSLDLCKVPTTAQITERLGDRQECLRMATEMRVASQALLELHDIPEYQVREQLAIRGLPL